MTTIAWDGITIAHDSQATAGNLVIANVQKLFPSPQSLFIFGEEASLITCSGNNSDHRYAVHFMRNCTEDGLLEMADELSFCAWVFTNAGRCWAIQKQSDNVIPSVYEVIPPATVGSGSDIAMTAMYLGQTAEQAVITASVLDAFTDSNVKTHLFKYGEVMK